MPLPSSMYIYILSPILLLLSWLCVNHYEPWRAFYNDFLAFLALFALFVATYATPKKISLLLVLISIVFFSVIAQLLANVNYFVVDPLMVTLYITAGFVAYQIGLAAPNSSQFVEGLALTLLIGSLLSTVIGTLQWLGISSLWVHDVGAGRSSGNLGQANNYASLVFWGLCAVAYLCIKGRLSFGFCSAIGAFLALGLVVSGSRTPLLQAVFFAIWALAGLRHQVTLTSRLAATTPLLFFAVLYLAFPYIDAVITGDELSELRIISGRYSNRIVMWESVLIAVLKSGWLGYGWGQVSVAQVTHLTENIGSVGFTEHSHNVLLDVLIWAGPLFGSLIIGLAIYWIGRQFLHSRSIDSWFLLSCVGAMLIHANLEYPLEYAYFLLPFCLMLGLVDNEQGRGISFSFKAARLLKAGVLVAAVPLVVLVWKEYRILEKDHRLMRAQNFGLQVDPDLRLSENVWLIDGERDYIRYARTPAVSGMSPADLDWMKKVTYRYPFAVVVYRYSVALGLNGHDGEAQKELDKLKIYYGAEMYDYYKFHYDQSMERGSEI